MSASLALSLLRALAVACIAVGAARAAPCYDVGKGEPKFLTGVLRYILFPGPPNYTDVQRGDTPEPTYVLQLDHTICIQGDPFADPADAFDAVHLVGNAALWPVMRDDVGKTVGVALTQPMAAETGHHHEPLVAWVTSIVTFPAKMTILDEYGTPATTIRAFYELLGDGRGADAAMLVVPEKRSQGPFAPENLKRFFGRLNQPIDLLGIDEATADTFIAHYRYTAGTSVCNGQALVTTVKRQGRNYIQSIKAMNGC